MRVNRAAVAAKDARTPGYRAAVEAMATGGTDTHYEVPQASYIELATRRKPAALVRRRRFVAFGDLVEKTLSSVGITTDLVKRITRRPCKCKARQRWMNEAGFALQRKAAGLVVEAAKIAGFGR